MSKFSFNNESITNVISKLEALEGQLTQISNEIRDLDGNLKDDISYGQQIISAILKSAEQVEKDSKKVAILKTSIEEISMLYLSTEKDIVELYESGSNGKSEIVTHVQQLVNRIKEYIRKFLTSIGLLPGGSNNVTSEYAGEPVDMCIGNYVNSITELCLYGEPNLRFIRNYNSRFPQFGKMGIGWSHNFECRLKISDENLIYCEGDGRQERYKPDKDGLYSSAFGGYSIIVRTKAGFCLYDRNSKEIHFDGEGKMVSYSEGDGGFVRCYYEGNNLTRVQASKTRAFYFEYNEEGMLSTLKDNIGRTLSFTYTNGMLTTVVSADGSTEKYEYDDTMRLSALINACGIRVLENKYDDEYRVIHQQFPDGTEMKYEYEDNALRFIDRNGSETVYYHDDSFRHTRTVFEYGEESYVYNENNERVTFVDLDGARWQREFNKEGYVISLTDPLGFVTRYERERDGKVIGIKYPDGSVREQVYDDAGHLIEISDGTGGVQHMQYDGDRLSTVTDPDGAVQHLNYDEEGCVSTIIDGNGYAMHFEYDGVGRIIRHINRRGHITEMKYDDMDRITMIRDPLGGERCFEYTPTGKLAKEKDTAGNVERWSYNNMGLLSSYVNKEGGTTHYEYDNMGNQTHIIFPDGSNLYRRYNHANRVEWERFNDDEPRLFGYDHCGRLIIERRGLEEKTYSYDAAGRLISQTNWDGSRISVERDSLGNVTRRLMPDGSFVRFSYDAAGRCTQEIHSSGKETNYKYSCAGKLISRVDGSGNGANYRYDAEGNIIEAVFSDNNFLRYRYDEESNLIERYIKSGYVEKYTYDELGRRVEVQDSDGRSKRLIYNNAGQIAETIDASGNHAAYSYSPAGKLLCLRDEAGQTTRYRYDAMGRLTVLLKGEENDEIAEMIMTNSDSYQSIDNNKWHLTSWKYDGSGRIREIRNARGECESFYWDGFGRLSTRIDQNGNRMDYSYLAGGVLSEIRYGGEVKTRYYYDAPSNRLTMEDCYGSSSFIFDIEGNLIHSKDCFDHTVDYIRDSNGLLSSMKTEDAVYSYEYECSGRMIAQALNGAKVSYRYNSDGRICDRIMKNGNSEHYEYTTAGQLARLECKDVNGVFFVSTYSYDRFGNLSEKCEEFKSGSKITLNYSYDELHRIIQRKENGVISKKWSYDVYGNCITTSEQGLLTEYRYNVLNQLIEKQENGRVTATYKYDPRGNLIQETETGFNRRYFYDSENRLVKVEASDGTRVEYLWDGMGHRLGKIRNGVKTLYGIDFSRTHHNVVAIEEGSQRRNLLWDSGLVTVQKDNDYSWFFRDGLASVRGESDNEGNINQCWRYDEFGQIIESNGEIPEFGFAGFQFDDESRTYFAQQRAYAPQIGRFINKDKERYIYTTIPESVNLYTYCRNNPLIYVDPEGTDCYIFYLPEWKNEAYADRGALAQRYGYGEEHVHMIPINNNNDLSTGWNGMGTVNGQQVDIDTVVIDSHASPRGLGYNGSNDLFNAQDIRALDNKDVRELCLYGCNAGHMDYANTNPAAEFARRVNGAQVLASDGTVYSDFDSHKPQSYDSRADTAFQNLLRNGKRDNYGWVEYQYIDGKIQTRLVNDKQMKLTEMTDYLRQRRGTICNR